jgi:glutathione peroxidase
MATTRTLFSTFILVMFLSTACQPETPKKAAETPPENKRSETAAVATDARATPVRTQSNCGTPLNYEMQNIDGTPVSLCDYAGKVVLAVNTASFCGYTPQYEQLEALYQKYRDRGFVILGFPANEFGEQEPGSNKDIKNFCEEKYKVTFPMFSKTVVKGENPNPFYKTLIQKTGEEPLWNFHKYLIDRKGNVVSYKSAVRPLSKPLVADIEKAL